MFNVKIILTNGKTYEKVMDDNECDEFMQNVIHTNNDIGITLEDGCRLCIPDEIIDSIEIKDSNLCSRN